MNKGILYSLISQPIQVHTGTLSGKLLVDGNITQNLLLFRFQFDTYSCITPLFIEVKVLQKVYRYFCDIRDFSNPIMKTPVIRPDFDMKNKIEILQIGCPVFSTSFHSG